MFTLKDILRWVLQPLDRQLLILYFLCAMASFLLLSSAAADKVAAQMVNYLVAFIALWCAARLPPQWLSRLVVPAYVLVLVLLVGVQVAGELSKGARRWLDVGIIRFQPSELAKLAVPMMMAWYFQKKEEYLAWPHHVVAAAFLLIPVALVLVQPDLGTAVLLLAIGAGVLFCIGLSWKFFVSLAVIGLGAIPIAWPFLHDYQKNRVLVLFDPEQDALGTGFHTIQSMIAVGSGGLFGKGWGNGTQSQLNFLPEHHTDFIFAVLAEEYGLLGGIALLALFLLLLRRVISISARAPDLFSRLLAASICTALFMSVAANLGMVTGLLPVVGVPLPLISYGGTALVTFSLMLGLLMNIGHQYRLMQR